MIIKIKKNASMIYIRNESMTVNWIWAEMLEQIEGKFVEVETEYLFKDQFNTVPIPKVSESGMRIMESSVELVIDDIRPQKMSCHWCDKVSDKGLSCEHCGKKRYLVYL